MPTSDSTGVYSELYPEWIKDQAGVGYDEDFWEIINFYLLHSLCANQSWKGDTLHGTYLWKERPWRPESYLKGKIIAAIWGDGVRRLYVASPRNSLKDVIQGKDLEEDFYKNIRDQRAGYVKSGSQIMSLFHHIRNGLAHGRYGIAPTGKDDYMIFIEDGAKDDERFDVTARIALKKSSLLKVRDVIQAGPDEEPDYAADIIASIRAGNNTKEKIARGLGIPKEMCDRQMHLLKQENKIGYNRSSGIWEAL